ncbi:MAG: hypothetical protein HY786_06925 [Deltaproteobacteria bacterium]|nr:hypothetical protein [Deltaproteobacteria bacterium]
MIVTAPSTARTPGSRFNKAFSYEGYGRYRELGQTVSHPSHSEEREEPCIVKIQALQHLKLTVPLDAVVEIDADGFIARTVDLPLYGFGNDRLEAISALKKEIESLYNDLMEDDRFTDEWLGYKNFLKKRVAPAR